MSTLEEIEAAVWQLSLQQRQQLLLDLAQNLRQEDSLPEPRQFTLEEMRAWMDEDERDMKRFKESK